MHAVAEEDYVALPYNSMDPDPMLYFTSRLLSFKEIKLKVHAVPEKDYVALPYNSMGPHPMTKKYIIELLRNKTQGARSCRRGLRGVALQPYGSPRYAIFHIPDNREI